MPFWIAQFVHLNEIDDGDEEEEAKAAANSSSKIVEREKMSVFRNNKKNG